MRRCRVHAPSGGHEPVCTGRGCTIMTRCSMPHAQRALHTPVTLAPAGGRRWRVECKGKWQKIVNAVVIPHNSPQQPWSVRSCAGRKKALGHLLSHPHSAAQEGLALVKNRKSVGSYARAKKFVLSKTAKENSEWPTDRLLTYNAAGPVRACSGDGRRRHCLAPLSY